MTGNYNKEYCFHTIQNWHATCQILSLPLSLKKAKRRRVVGLKLELTVHQIQVRCASIQMNWKIAQIAWWTVKLWCGYAKFTLHDFSPIFHSPTGFDILPTNARHRRQIGARSREWQSRSVNSQGRNLRESRCIAVTRKIFAMLNIWSCRRFTYLLCEWVLTEKYISDDLQPMREQDTGQREARGGLKRLAIYKQRAYILALEYTDQVGYITMKKELGVFL